MIEIHVRDCFYIQIYCLRGRKYTVHREIYIAGKIYTIHYGKMVRVNVGQQRVQRNIKPSRTKSRRGDRTERRSEKGWTWIEREKWKTMTILYLYSIYTYMLVYLHFDMNHVSKDCTISR